MADDESSNLLAYLVIGIIAFALILVLIRMWYVSTQDTNGSQQCWNSIDQHEKVLAISHNDEVTDIKCPTRNTTIGKDEKSEEVNAKIAQAWATCWYEWHRGNVELFNKEGVYCHVCQVFTFEDRKTIDGLPTYLRTHNAPGNTISYFAYLTPFSTKDTAYLKDLEVNVDDVKAKANDLALTQESIQIDGKPFAIMIMYAKGQTAIEELLAGNREGSILAGTGLVIGGVAVGGTAASLIPVVGLTGPIGIGLVVGAAAVVGGVAVVKYVFEPSKPPQWMAVSAFKPYDAKLISDLKCSIAPVKQK